MTYLSKLPEDIQDIVIRLPFRVGLYISESDQAGGDESSEAERKALENIVTFYVEDTVKSEFAHEVMLQTLNRKAEWASWSDNISNVPTQCENVVYAMKGLIDPKEILAYKQNLLEVGIAVAQAYCEYDEGAGALNKLEFYISLFFRRLQLSFSGGGEDMPSRDYMLNISGSERQAILSLAKTLDVSVRI